MLLGWLVAAALAGDLVSYVDPTLGVRDGRSNCVIGPQLPWGSINPSPDTREGGDSGYKQGQPVRGFSQLHVSGTGWGKYGQILVSPQIGLATGETEHDSPITEEAARADAYAVTLARYGIRVELAPTAHAALYRFTFPASSEASLLLDITHAIPGDLYPEMGGAVSDGRVSVTGPDRVVGWGQYRGGFADGVYNVYFAATFSRPAAGFGTWRNEVVTPGSRVRGIVRQDDRVGAFLRYATKPDEPIFMKIGVSLKSVEQAERYADTEIPDWNIETVKAGAALAWNRELGRIAIDGAGDADKRLFYSALYHAMLMPRDRTGDNPNWNSEAPYWDDQYAVWDTWRTLFPLLTLIKPSVVCDNVNSFVDRLEHNGIVRDGFAAGHEMDDQQGGDDVDNVIADAWAKGVPGIDWEQAYAVLRHDAEHERLATPREYHDPDTTRPNPYARDSYRSKGWLPAGIMSCSLTLEFAYNDFCAAQVARGLGHDEDSARYLARSHKWEALWNAEAESDGFRGFVAPRRADGSWIEPFDPKERFRSWKEYFYEGSSWTYSYFVPHDLGRLIALSGGPAAFTRRLEHALEAGLIEFANEPGFLALHTFNYAGRPDLTATWLRKARALFADGYPGNDDSGAMSSWYVFASLGFFPNAGQDVYLVGSPVFPRATLVMENGKALVIEARGAAAANPYVQSATLNGRPLATSWFRHGDIRDGGRLEFVMGPKPSSWGRDAPPPPSSSR